MTQLTRTSVNEQLRHWLTPKGVRQWWERPAWQLDSLTPNQAWAAGRKQEVYDFAEGGRETIAT